MPTAPAQATKWSPDARGLESFLARSCSTCSRRRLMRRRLGMLGPVSAAVVPRQAGTLLIRVCFVELDFAQTHSAPGNILVKQRCRSAAHCLAMLEMNHNADFGRITVGHFQHDRENAAIGENHHFHRIISIRDDAAASKRELAKCGAQCIKHRCR